MIYLDSSATSPLLPEVKKKIFEILEKQSHAEIGNASSLYSSGIEAKNLIEEARAKVAKLIDAEPSEILFTSGGSESNNSVIKTFENKSIATSAIEHPSILRAAETYAKNLIKIPVNKKGIIDKTFLENLINSSKPPTLISIMLANNELGTIEPIPKLPHIKIHSDVTQAVGKIPISVKKLNVNYLSFSGHKIGGPLGVGILYIKSGSPFKPLILGGEQENSRRAGTYNLPGIVGLGVAAEYCLKNKTWEIYKEKIRPLRDYLAKKLLKKIPTGKLNTPLNNSVPNILNISFPAAEGESIQLYLDLEGIQVSTGSACASGSLEPSHVLMAIHHNPESAHNSIRFSLSLDTTKTEIETVIEKLPPIVNRLQKISTIKIKENQNG